MASVGKQRRWGLIVGLVAGVLGAVLWMVGSLDRFENLTWDWRVRQLARPSDASRSVVLVLVDQASLDWGSQTNGWPWPWPREVYTAVVDFCRRAGARTITFDMLFTEPSFFGVADDELLGGVLGASRDAVVGCAVDGDGVITWPVPEIRQGAAYVGNVAGLPDADAIIRRAAPATTAGDTVVASLALATYLVAEGGRPAIFDDPTRPRVLAYAPAGTYAAYSAAAIVQSELRLLEGGQPVIDPVLLRGRHVFFGVSAPGLLDQRATPLSRVSPGVVIHATAFDNIMTGGFIAPAPLAAVLAVTVLLGLIAGLLAVQSSRAWQHLLLFAVGLPLPLVLGLLLYGAGVWWPVAPPGVAILVGLVSGLGVNWATEGRQRRFLKQAFRHYLSPHVVERLVKDPDRLQLGGERRTLTIFFSDLAGFTSLGETLEPEELTALLNDYLTAMTDIVLEEGGTLDKYEGDAIIAFWNAPLDVPDHAERACRAAVRCQQTLADRRELWLHRYGSELFQRIGIHTGDVVVGNLGSRQRFDYTILGDAANLASRLEGVNKVFGTGTLVSAATIEAGGGAMRHRELGRVQVVGRDEPVTVFELDLKDGPYEPPGWKTYHQALELCRAGQTTEAYALANSLTDDPAAVALAASVRADADFRGLWKLTSK